MKPSNIVSTCIITYDRTRDNAGDYDYGPLWAELKRLSAWRLQESVWIIRTILSADALADRLAPLLHQADLLFVAKIDTNETAIRQPPALKPRRTVLAFRKGAV